MAPAQVLLELTLGCKLQPPIHLRSLLRPQPIPLLLLLLLELLRAALFLRSTLLVLLLLRVLLLLLRALLCRLFGHLS